MAVSRGITTRAFRSGAAQRVGRQAVPQTERQLQRSSCGQHRHRPLRQRCCKRPSLAGVAAGVQPQRCHIQLLPLRRQPRAVRAQLVAWRVVLAANVRIERATLRHPRHCIQITSRGAGVAVRSTHARSGRESRRVVSRRCNRPRGAAATRASERSSVGNAAVCRVVGDGKAVMMQVRPDLRRHKKGVKQQQPIPPGAWSEACLMRAPGEWTAGHQAARAVGRQRKSAERSGGLLGALSTAHRGAPQLRGAAFASVLPAGLKQCMHVGVERAGNHSAGERALKSYRRGASTTQAGPSGKAPATHATYSFTTSPACARPGASALARP